MGAEGQPAVGAFEFLSVEKIIFGRGSISRVAELAGELGRRALLVSNAGDAGDGGPVDRVAALLTEANIGCAFVRQRGEPTVDGVGKAADVARSEECDLVIGLGGGSAIDAAKAVAALLTNGGGPLDYMEVIGEGRTITQPAAPWIAVPTTAGTGAEVTRNAVIACPEKHFKASIRNEHLLARAVVVDAELAVGVSPEISARAGMDALCQLIESYTSARAQPLTDLLARNGLWRAGRSLLRACTAGDDLDARENMALAALFSGITLTNAGLGAAHGFASPLGANFPVPHGVVCAALLAPVMEANVKALQAERGTYQALHRYAEVGKMLTGKLLLGDEEAIDMGLEFVADLVRELNVPGLSSFGLTAERIPEMVALAGKSSSMKYNPVRLSDQVLTEILESAL